MKKKLFLKFFVLAVIGAFVTFTSCKDYDDDINKLQSELNSLRTDLTSKIDAAKSDLTSQLNSEIATLNTALNAAKDRLTAAEGKLSALETAQNATQAELNAAKAEITEAKADIVGLATRIGVLEQFKASAEADLATLKGQVTALENDKASKAELEAAKVALEGQIDTLREDLEALEEAAATKDELEAAVKALQDEITDLEESLTFVTDALAGRITSLEENSATKDELATAVAALELKITTKFGELNTALDALGVRVGTLETNYTELLGKHNAAVQDYINRIAALRGELKPRIDNLETVLDLNEEGKSKVIADIYEKLGEQLQKINENATDIANLTTDLNTKYGELIGITQGLQGQITVLDGKVTTNTNNITALKGRMDKAEKDIENINKEIERVEKKLNLQILRIDTLFGFTRQLKGLTFIPTRGLPQEKTMKLYYFAGDYSAEHVLMYRVSPSNAQLGRDFEVESLNYQITTRSADDGVLDNSKEVDVHINPAGKYYVSGQTDMVQGIKQFGDVLYVPVHVKSAEPCEVFGNIDWWCNKYYSGNWNVLSSNNFPKHVVKTIKNPDVDYWCEYGDDEGYSTLEGLSLVLTATGKNVDEAAPKGSTITIKSTEHVNTFLVPTQIKLAESRDGKGNQLLDANLKERTLNTTFTAAVNWANTNENTLPNDNKNWNVLAWSGNQGAGGVWTPGTIDLYDYVSSFYYPQDGGDFTRANTVQGDPHRYLWAEFGKEFGKPYTDKPHYDKPVYEFEQMTWKDTNHNITIGPEVGEDGATHSYASLNGSILTVHNDASSIQGVRNKKIIIKVTQVNSDCEERQPVGYLVIKYTDDPNQQWPDAFHTIDLTHIPYYHKECRSTDPVGELIKKTYTENDPNAVFNRVDAHLDHFAHDRWMSPINAPGSYGMTGVINPGDVNVILGSNLQLNGIGEHNMGVIYNIQRRDASVVPGSMKFTPADNNHINVTDPTSPVYVSVDDAFEHVMIRYEYDNHSYIVYVDDKAPAGEYEIEYELLNMENNTQHGNRLYLTFKFKVALREITVERDTPNWLNENTIRGTHTRVGNSIDPNSGVGTSQFLSSLDGYKVDLKQAFILGTGTNQNILVTTQEPTGAGPNPNYRPMFEFIQDAGIVAAGFSYHRDTDNYLTIIKLGTQDAAVIDNSPSGSSSPDYNYLTIYVNEAGDKLYNYLTQDVNTLFGPHNTITKWGKKELRLDDDMERLLPVRMVTDINGACQVEDVPVGGTPSVFVDRFPNGNYYYIMDFNVKFERALRWAFTTVELDDSQYLQSEAFNFRTKYVDPLDEDLDIYRGLFDHSYDDATDHYGNLVYPAVQFSTTGRHNRGVQAWYYGLATSLSNPDFATAPTMVRENHVQPNVSTNYQGIDYKFVEISTDGGNTWAPMDNDYQVNSTHTARYFDIIYTPGTYVFGQPVTPPSWTAIWQGDHTPLNQDLYFRVPVYNTIATGHGLDLSTATADDLWVGYRDGWAKVKGYAVFKINKQ